MRHSNTVMRHSNTVMRHSNAVMRHSNTVMRHYNISVKRVTVSRALTLQAMVAQAQVGGQTAHLSPAAQVQAQHAPCFPARQYHSILDTPVAL